MNNIYYCGCISGEGHSLFNVDLRRVMGLEEQSLYLKLGLNHIDWDNRIRPLHVKSGNAKLTYLNSYTVLSFYDSTYSTGPTCHSTYVIPGFYEFDQALAICQDTFPSIFARYKFRIELEGRCAVAA